MIRCTAGNLKLERGSLSNGDKSPRRTCFHRPSAIITSSGSASLYPWRIMSTVILGAGIIGASIAYYLSASEPQGEIHIIDQSQELFASASGFAGGFLARDWFALPLAPLGALSFDLHHELAAEHGGDKKWGFMRGTAFSLDTVSRRKTDGISEDDWMETGASRAETATGSEDTDSVDWPAWLTQQAGGALERISEEDTVAQV